MLIILLLITGICTVYRWIVLVVGWWRVFSCNSGRWRRAFSLVRWNSFVLNLLDFLLLLVNGNISPFRMDRRWRRKVLSFVSQLFFLLFSIQSWVPCCIFVLSGYIRIVELTSRRLLTTFWYILSTLVTLLFAFLNGIFKLHTRNGYLFKHDAVSIFLQIFCCMDYHIDLSHRSFIEIIAENKISHHFEIFLCCYESSLSQNLIEVSIIVDFDSQSVKDKN
jgi:hypothetical protein